MHVSSSFILLIPLCALFKTSCILRAQPPTAQRRHWRSERHSYQWILRHQPSLAITNLHQSPSVSKTCILLVKKCQERCCERRAEAKLFTWKDWGFWLAAAQKYRQVESWDSWFAHQELSNVATISVNVKRKKLEITHLNNQHQSTLNWSETTHKSDPTVASRSQLRRPKRDVVRGQHCHGSTQAVPCHMQPHRSDNKWCAKGHPTATKCQDARDSWQLINVVFHSPKHLKPTGMGAVMPLLQVSIVFHVSNTFKVSWSLSWKLLVQCPDWKVEIFEAPETWWFQ